MRPLQRFAIVTAATWPLLGIYMVINHWQTAFPKVLTMPSWMPFRPEFTPVYLGLLLAVWLLPVAIRDGARFRACLWGMILGHVLVMPWWLLMPTTLPRPPVPLDWWAEPYRWLVTADPPNNVTPCAHGIGPMVAVWFVGGERRTWRWPLVAMLAVGLASIALIWQHRPVDILLGMVAGVAGVVFGERLLRATRALQ
jgi:hypothetical protein